MFGLSYNPTAAVRALTPAKGRWLGGLLLRQLPDPVKAFFTTHFLLF